VKKESIEDLVTKYGREPDVWIGKSPYWINYVGVDKKTGKEVTGKTQKPIGGDEARLRRTNVFLENAGYCPVTD